MKFKVYKYWIHLDIGYTFSVHNYVYVNLSPVTLYLWLSTLWYSLNSFCCV